MDHISRRGDRIAEASNGVVDTICLGSPPAKVRVPEPEPKPSSGSQNAKDLENFFGTWSNISLLLDYLLVNK